MTVRYKDRDSLATAALEKVNSYRALADHLRVVQGRESVAVLLIVVGSRGALPRATQQSLKTL